MLLTKDSNESSAVFLPDETTIKKVRLDSTSSTEGTYQDHNSPTSTVRNLEMERVKELFQGYDLLNSAGAVACVVCGKSYKSKVCVKKHLWEHSVYWDLFDGLKKQQRVLSIQAALILAIKFNPSLSLLLVTQPSNTHKKQKTENAKRPSENANNVNNDNTQRKNENRIPKGLSTENVFNNNNNNNNNTNLNLNNISGARKRKIYYNNILEEKKRTFKFQVYQDFTQRHVNIPAVEVTTQR